MPTVSKDGRATSEVRTVSILRRDSVTKSRDPKVQSEEEELDVAKHGGL